MSLIIVGGLGFIAYSIFFMAPSADVSSVASSTDSTGDGNDIVSLAQKLQNVKIDQTLFSSNIFKSLKDYSAPVTPEPQGRPNPFASIGNDANFVPSTPVTKPATTTQKSAGATSGVF